MRDIFFGPYLSHIMRSACTQIMKKIIKNFIVVFSFPNMYLITKHNQKSFKILTLLENLKTQKKFCYVR